MERRIAPNNNLPATHFIEVWHSRLSKRIQKSTKIDCIYIEGLDDSLAKTSESPLLYTVCLFKIRTNKLPTKHKFI